MALTIADRVLQTGSANTTASFTLSGSVSGYQSFAVVGNGNTTYYGAQDGTNWEVGIGTYSTTGPTLTRTTIISSSNSGSAVSTFTSPVTVYVTQPSEYAVYVAGSNIVVPNSAILGTANGGTGLNTFTANGIVFASTTSVLATAIGLTWNGTTFNASAVTSGGNAVLTTANYNSYALPLSGGNITGQLYVKASTSYSNAALQLGYGDNNTGSLAYIQQAFQYQTGGYSHFITSRHDSAGATSGNALLFYLNVGATAGASSAPGTGNYLSYFMNITSHNWYVSNTNYMSLSSSALSVTGAVNSTTANITPNTTGVSTGLTVVNGDITTYRSGGTTGVIYLGSSGSKYLYFDGTNYIMPGAALTLNGSNVVTSAQGSAYLATAVQYLPGRTDTTAYPVLWGASYTSGSGTIAYSCSAVTITSSTGSLNASNLYAGFVQGTNTNSAIFYGNGNTASASGTGMYVYSTGGNGAIMAFHRGGYYAVNMGLDSDNVIRIGGWSASANRLQLDMNGNLTVAGTVNGTNIAYNSYSTYSTVSSPTAKNGWSGMLAGTSTYALNYMCDGNNGGIYRESNGAWPIYYSSSGATGINGSGTTGGYGVQLNGNTWTTGYMVLNGAVTVNPSGTMPGQFARAWVSFAISGSTFTIYNYVNVSSITYSAVGTYNIVFTTAFPSNRYTGAATASYAGNTGNPSIINTATVLNVSFYRVFINDIYNNSNDPSNLQVTCFY
jgi:hypothetical protein